jgi:hypothetical protein
MPTKCDGASNDGTDICGIVNGLKDDHMGGGRRDFVDSLERRPSEEACHRERHAKPCDFSSKFIVAHKERYVV